MVPPDVVRLRLDTIQHPFTHQLGEPGVRENIWISSGYNGNVLNI